MGTKKVMSVVSFEVKISCVQSHSDERHCLLHFRSIFLSIHCHPIYLKGGMVED
jgi:hypothetical protein